jgi:hypothetical protein
MSALHSENVKGRAGEPLRERAHIVDNFPRNPLACPCEFRATKWGLGVYHYYYIIYYNSILLLLEGESVK